MKFCFSASHQLCCRVKHFLVQTKAELHDALAKSHVEQVDCVVEVENCIDDNAIDDNANFHRLSSKLVLLIIVVYIMCLYVFPILQNYKYVRRPFCNPISGLSSGRSIF